MQAARQGGARAAGQGGARAAVQGDARTAGQQGAGQRACGQGARRRAHAGRARVGSARAGRARKGSARAGRARAACVRGADRAQRAGQRAASRAVVVQWDPERDLLLNRLNYRSIQIGLRGDVAAAYARGEYIERIADVTELFREVHRLGVREGRVEEAARLLPAEAEFPVAPAVRSALRMDAPLAGEAAAS
ncbi:unnamed protein product [Closterium sp. NIES-64]|nr:unnamed protein product [Closterium sp. NIES-64]